MVNTDSLQRFIFENIDIRGAVVHLNESFKTIIEQHEYPRPIANLLGEALAIAVLLSATLKYKGQLSIQFQSTGPVKLLIAKCNDRFEVRGVAQFNSEILETLDPQTHLLGDGNLIVTVEQEEKLGSYQSVIPLENRSITESIESYFAQSEQLSTKIWLAVGNNSIAGMLLQLMPGQSTQTRENFWEYAVKMGETVKNAELLTLENAILLTRLYHEENVRIFDEQAVIFKCTCNTDRMENAVRMLGEEDANALIQEHKNIAVKCEFCSYEYIFNRNDVAHIFQQKKDS